MARKTYPVKALVNTVNSRLSTANTTPEARWALISLLETVLQQTGNYNGFRYQRSEYLPAEEQTDTNVLRPDYDDTRRHYYLPKES
jgi:hypothetical protein